MFLYIYFLFILSHPTQLSRINSDIHNTSEYRTIINAKVKIIA